MIKKKVFILMSSMHLGGAETALLGLLEALDYDKIEVDLFLLRHEGELVRFIPKQVNLLPEDSDYSCLSESIQQTFKRGKIILALAKAWGLLLARIKTSKYAGSINGDYMHKWVTPHLPKLYPERIYDLAISFIFPHYIVATKIQARHKVAWIHTDYTSVIMDHKSQTKMWSQYKKIISISESVSESFKKVFPTLADRLLVIENILPESYINNKANEETSEYESMKDKNIIKILSIGRFTIAKNFDNVPDICRRICEQGINICWYLIGYGGDEKLIRNKIYENKMEDNVIILGKKDNPYPYIKSCDVYVQPSRFEGKSIAVREAQLLGKPVIITSYPTSKSQLKDGIDGMIVPQDNKECADAIVKILKSHELLLKISSNCKHNDYTMKDEIKKLYQLL